jgi:hypothetical protein
MQESGIRKWIGFFVILIVLFVGAVFLKDQYKTYAEYAFYAFLVFVGGNALEHIKGIVQSFRK